MSNPVGPVCHIPPATTPGAPQPLNLPGLPGPATPNDINSIVSLVNSLRLMLVQMSDQTRARVVAPPTNRRGPGPPPDKNRDPQWAEVDRQTHKVRVYQNNDKTSQNYVDVEQINSLTMQDRHTGALWRWNRSGEAG